MPDEKGYTLTWTSCYYITGQCLTWQPLTFRLKITPVLLGRDALPVRLAQIQRDRYGQSQSRCSRVPLGHKNDTVSLRKIPVTRPQWKVDKTSVTQRDSHQGKPGSSVSLWQRTWLLCSKGKRERMSPSPWQPLGEGMFFLAGAGLVAGAALQPLHRASPCRGCSGAPAGAEQQRASLPWGQGWWESPGSSKSGSETRCTRATCAGWLLAQLSVPPSEVHRAGEWRVACWAASLQ